VPSAGGQTAPNERGQVSCSTTASSQTGFAPSAGVQTSFAPNSGVQTSFAPNGCGQTASAPNALGSQTTFAPNLGSGQTTFAPNAGIPGLTNFSPVERGVGSGMSQASVDVGRDAGSPCASGASQQPHTSFSPIGGLGGCLGGGLCGGFGGIGGFGGMPGLMGGMGGCGMDFMNMGMMGMGANELMLRAALQGQHPLQSAAVSQLLILLPDTIIQKVLVPQGYLTEIAQRCHVRIDLGSAVPPNLRQVALSGSVAANSTAVYFLQEKALQCGV